MPRSSTRYRVSIHQPEHTDLVPAVHGDLIARHLLAGLLAVAIKEDRVAAFFEQRFESDLLRGMMLYSLCCAFPDEDLPKKAGK